MEIIESRDFQVPKGRVKKWAEKVGLPADVNLSLAERAEKSISDETDAANSPESSSSGPNTDSNTFDSGRFHFFAPNYFTDKNLLTYSVPDLEDCEPEQPVQQRVASTPVAKMVSQDQFEALADRVNDFLEKFYAEQEKSTASRDCVVQMERKWDHLEGNVLPDLKTRIKTVKKSIPADVALPTKNKETLEQVRAQLERARAKIAVLESQKPEQKIKISDSSIAALFGTFHINHLFISISQHYNYNSFKCQLN